MIKIFIIFLSAILLSGCLGYHFNTNFQKQPIQEVSSNQGYVLFSDFDIPQPVKRAFQVSSAGYALTDSVDLYDITDDIIYIGPMYIHPPVFKNSASFIEKHLPIGKRIFMLTHTSKMWGIPLNIDYADFIEVNVTNDRTTYISISFYAENRKSLIGLTTQSTVPKFTQVLFDDKAFEYCSKLTGDQESKEQNISNFMQQSSIDPRQKFFKDYCFMLGHNRKAFTVLDAKGYESFEKEKPKIQEFKNQALPKWQKSVFKNKAFPLIQPIWVLQKMEDSKNPKE